MTDRAIIDWPAWTDSPPGRYVLDWEQTQLDRVVSDVFGYHALQLGLPQLDALRENRMPCRGLVLDAASGASAPYTYPRGLQHAGSGLGNRARHGAPTGLPAPAGRSAVWCDLLDLPFEAQSVDLIAFTRLKDWIKLLGFDLERGRFGCYRPPLSSDQWLARYGFMEAAGDRWWPIFGATYMIKAIKRVPGMRLVGPLKMKKPVLAPGLAPAATPNTRNDSQ